MTSPTAEQSNKIQLTYCGIWLIDHIVQQELCKSQMLASH